MELLFHEYVSNIYINDLSKHVFAFWECVTQHTEEFCRLINDTSLDIETWDRQRRTFLSNDADNLSLGFATFYLNRTNRSGILNGGIIGGRAQSGPWGIGARFNKNELIYRIQEIAKLKKKINISQLDALTFLKTSMQRWSRKALIYMDPPYFKKGRDLYYDFYQV